MALVDDLKAEVKETFAKVWTTSKGQVVPDPGNLSLGNEARDFERATILYADLAGSTAMVDGQSWMLAGEIYKSYLTCAAKIVRARGGVITAYDGDRLMAVFLGDLQTSNAAKCGLQINWAVINIVNPLLKAQYPTSNYSVQQIVGIDTGQVRAARVGVRGGNDLVWIGKPANYAAKLTENRKDYPTWLTREAYAQIANWAKYGGENNQNMWTEMKWTAMNDIPVYGSAYWWRVE